MEKKSKIPQIYGYAVCLVAIITFLISLAAIINSVMDAKDPFYSFGDDPKLSSYENFKAETLNSGNKDEAYIPDEATLQTMYKDLRDHKINRVKHQTTKTIFVNSILLVLCIFLFSFHWIWIQRLSKQED